MPRQNSAAFPICFIPVFKEYLDLNQFHALDGVTRVCGGERPLCGISGQRVSLKRSWREKRELTSKLRNVIHP